MTTTPACSAWKTPARTKRGSDFWDSGLPSPHPAKHARCVLRRTYRGPRKMFSASITKAQMSDIIKRMSAVEFSRLRYCQEMAGAYLAVNLFEHTLIHAMYMCDRVWLEKALGQDLSRWQQSLSKHALLRGSTLGSLIKILERHGISQADINYLTWIKDKRDYFIHRLFHDGAWPGDLDEEGSRAMARRLLAIQVLFSRAERRLWVIFEKAGFVELDRLPDGSLLATNVGIYDLFNRTHADAT
jgi:hypothetical protein